MVTPSISRKPVATVVFLIHAESDTAIIARLPAGEWSLTMSLEYKVLP